MGAKGHCIRSQLSTFDKYFFQMKGDRCDRSRSGFCKSASFVFAYNELEKIAFVMKK